MAISFVFCALIVRLFVVQIINGKSLQMRATDQWTRDLKIEAPRGKILDRTGSALAVSYTTYNVFVRPREVENASVLAHKLATELELDFEAVYQKCRKKGISEILIKQQIEEEVAEKIYNLSENGVYLVENCGRYYPYGNLLTQVLGFTSIDNVGQSGVESYYNSVLKGENGFSFVQSDLQGREIGGSLRYYVGAKAGSDLTLTIDSKMQIALEQVLGKIMIEQKALSVSGLIMNAKTSQLLAVSSKPSFDLNDLPRDDLEKLFSRSKAKVVTDVYEPGSTFKILTVAAAIEEGLTSVNDRFYCPGYRMIDGEKIKCWKTIGHGSQTLKEAFANSCNCCFMDLALRLGTDKFYQYMQKFGLGKKTGVDISGEAGGILMAKKLVRRVDLARMGFGHAVAVTPIQLLTAVGCVTNGGNYTSPTITSKEQNSNLQNKGYTRANVISPATSEIVNQLLEFAENKAGPCTFVEGYNVGGKTGTAQKYDENGKIAQGKYISSFIGTYPANDPNYVVMIMVDQPSAGAYYGSIVAAPYGKLLFEKVFEYLGEEKQMQETVIEYVQMPDLENLSLSQAAAILKSLGVDYELDGDGQVITKQLPPAGTQVKKGDKVLLIC